ncbi:HD-GYP domain-containing protein [Thalassobacillus devorans]|uniref:HD-GYP domain-containing protein n=1 Tax=Thalassobacillus devorans TaxID=279813 RepID=UPI0004921CCF|nr:HD-GYP domain-containing protein [Thalassobacillus devorans]
MRGLNVFNKQSFLDNLKYTTNELRLLERGDGVEIMLQTIYKDNIFYIYPSDNTNIMEFFYILNGTLECDIEAQRVQLTQNDYYSVKNLNGPVHFKALTDVNYLWIITEPTFYYMSEYMRGLRDLVYKVEEKDRYTSLHSRRVTNYAVKVAQKLELGKEKLEKVHLAAELHDIGKINIPEEILNKPGKLTTEEFELIKRHPGEGADMVAKTYYKDLAPIIIQHHERLDGSGYPYGLTGEQISFEAKIIAVCDTFDAMTEDRTYRKAYKAEYAIEEIKSLAGIHYESEIVSVFEEVLKEEGNYYK